MDVDHEQNIKLLSVAIDENKLDTVKELISVGTPIKSLDLTNKLFLACKNGRNNLVKYLLGFYTKSKKPHMITDLLIIAAMYDNLEIIKYFFDMGINTKITDRSGNNLLHFSCGYGRLNVVRYLIETKHDINTCNDNKQTPFDFAIMAQNLPIILCLLGANPDLIKEKVYDMYILGYFPEETNIQFLFLIVNSYSKDIENEYLGNKVDDIQKKLIELFSRIYKNYPQICASSIYNQIKFIRETYIQVIESGSVYGIQRLKNLSFVFSSRDLAHLIKQHIRKIDYKDHTENVVITLVKKAMLEYSLSNLKDFSGYNLLHHALKYKRENLSRFLIFSSNKLLDNIINTNIPELLRISQIYY